MLFLNIFMLAIVCVSFSSCNPVYPRGQQFLPSPIGYRAYRSANGPRASPQSTMVFHGYYARPVIRTRQGLPLPDGAMTAFAAGETVQTGSAYLPPNPEYIPDCRAVNCQETQDSQRVAPISIDGNQQPSNELQPPENEPESVEQQEPEQNQIPIDSDVPVTDSDEPVLISSTTVKSVPKKAKKPNQPRREELPAPDDEEDDEDDGYNPFIGGGRRNFPVYNSFFPMMFGGGGGYGGVSGGSRKKGSQSDGSSSYPSGATAIANSFSTGKGGVATSHATAYGGPRP
ncbi:uncharacterized protein LOC123302265 [Chrysoperla carnea]|uniref:uncharacterized protein LOC123302265 n=1 Tax=Chrysoperla carnea TaxID=189513 RepID=UPI001D08B00F|nr:uncharacterized protein LOC123302265 [Chrysoperla carnea]